MPKMLYKPGSMYKIREGLVDYKVFEDDDIKAALKGGWSDNPVECLKPKKTRKPKTILDPEEGAVDVLD